MKIGKLDPKNLFDKSAESEYLEKEKEMFNNIVIGKLNTNNIFENDQIKEVEKKSVQVGKIKTKVILIYHFSFLFVIFIYFRNFLPTMTHMWPNRMLLLES